MYALGLGHKFFQHYLRPCPYSFNTQQQLRDIAQYLSKIIEVCCTY